ncbi:capsid scaffolding protein [Pasteurellaceae bacterium LFhippo2]|nr:capsid scaffolding protein [Pasteurellaceae bacterium LFhippo2]
MAKKSKWFVVATEGATTDGRNIARVWIEQMAKNYDPQNTYGARINLEHFKLWWYNPNEPHAKCYGDVLALKAEEREDGKLQLLAQIDPTPELIELNKQRQKIYTSIEVDTNFADTGEAYLMGLAVTDDPASLGTEMLSFSATAKANPLNKRKERPENLFSEAIETVFDFTEEPAEPSLFEKVKALLTRKAKKEDERFADQEQAVELLSTHLSELTDKYDVLLAEVAEKEQAFAKLSDEFTALKQRVEQVAQQPESNYTPSPEVTGATDNDGRFF